MILERKFQGKTHLKGQFSIALNLKCQRQSHKISTTWYAYSGLSFECTPGGHFIACQYFSSSQPQNALVAYQTLSVNIAVTSPDAAPLEKTLAPLSLAPFRGSRVTTAHAHQCCIFQSYAKTVPSRMKLTIKLTMREPAFMGSMTTDTWSRRVTSDVNSVYQGLQIQQITKEFLNLGTRKLLCYNQSIFYMYQCSSEETPLYSVSQ